MRVVLFCTLLPLLGCPVETGDKVGDIDSGDTCDRVHGALGVVLYGYDDAGTDESEDDAWSVRFPDTAPDGFNRTTGISGPLSDGVSWAALYGGRLLISEDEGCNWDDQGGVLPGTGDWQLNAEAATLYAFDRLSSQGAFSKDDGGSWTATNASDAFVAMPVPDPAIAGKLRGVQARGVVTSEDDGQNWDVSGTAPDGVLMGAAVSAGDLDSIVAATSTGVFLSRTGGASWADIGTNLLTAGLSPSRVAIHPANAGTVWVSGTDDDGVTIEATTDGGLVWKPIAATQNVDLDPTAALWPDPDQDNVVFTHFDTALGDGSVTMYRLFGGNIESHKVSTYTNLSDISFTGDGSWMAGVDNVP